MRFIPAFSISLLTSSYRCNLTLQEGSIHSGIPIRKHNKTIASTQRVIHNLRCFTKVVVEINPALMIDVFVSHHNCRFFYFLLFTLVAITVSAYAMLAVLITIANTWMLVIESTMSLSFFSNS